MGGLRAYGCAGQEDGCVAASPRTRSASSIHSRRSEGRVPNTRAVSNAPQRSRIESLTFRRIAIDRFGSNVMRQSGIYLNPPCCNALLTGWVGVAPPSSKTGFSRARPLMLSPTLAAGALTGRLPFVRYGTYKSVYGLNCNGAGSRSRPSQWDEPQRRYT
jgi:hypothetical protein